MKISIEEFAMKVCEKFEEVDSRLHRIENAIRERHPSYAERLENGDCEE